MYGLPLVKIVIATTLTAAVLISTANAQAVCGKRTEIVKQLSKKYGETRRSVGLQRGRGVVEVYASEKTGTWTILITNARGLSCLMAAGEAFEAVTGNTSDTASPI